MSPRKKILRKILNPPIIKGFKPYGIGTERKNPGQVNLLYEEYEALRLSDYDGLKHHQASVIMGVSRPTFTRIYASALQKVAKAFVEGKQITIEGGISTAIGSIVKIAPVILIILQKKRKLKFAPCVEVPK